MPYKDKAKQKEAQQRSYQANKAHCRERRQTCRSRDREFVRSQKKECCYCGEKDERCLDFHHLGDKTQTVCQLVRDAASIENIKAEIAKCEVVCSNCHKKRHVPQIITDGSDWIGFNRARVEKRQWFIELLGRSWCSCGEKDSRCLEFHHVAEKRYKISYLITSGHSLRYLQEEISRCEVLCSNCHRKEHSGNVW